MNRNNKILIYSCKNKPLNRKIAYKSREKKYLKVIFVHNDFYTILFTWISSDQEFKACRIRRSANFFSCKWRCCKVLKYESSRMSYEASDELKFGVFLNVSTSRDGDVLFGMVMISFPFGYLTGHFKRLSCIAQSVSGMLDFSRSWNKRDNVIDDDLAVRLLSVSPLHYKDTRIIARRKSQPKYPRVRLQKSSIYLWGDIILILQRGQETFLSDGASRLWTQRG